MSGGSYDYLCYKVDGDEFIANAPGFSNLEAMADRLAGLDWAEGVTDEVRSIIRRAKRLDVELGRLSNVFQAIEWWDSHDWGEDQARTVVEGYRAEKTEIDTDNLSDGEVEIYETGWTAGQRSMADHLHRDINRWVGVNWRPPENDEGPAAP